MLAARLSALLLLFATAAYAQWQPVTARIRQTKEITAPDGSVSTQAVKAGTFYRISNGSTLQRWSEVAGQPTNNVIGELLDNSSGTTYSIQYLDRRATIKYKGTPKPANLYRGVKASPIGQEVVGGVACQLFPIKDERSGRAVGQVCVSPQDELVLRVESFAKQPDGSSVRLITELDNVQIGTQPDSKLFDISQFSVVEMTPVTH